MSELFLEAGMYLLLATSGVLGALVVSLLVLVCLPDYWVPNCLINMFDVVMHVVIRLSTVSAIGGMLSLVAAVVLVIYGL